MVATFSLGRPYASSICSIFPLYKDSNDSEKSTNKCLLGFLYKLQRLSESVMLCIGFSGNHFDSFQEFSQFLVQCG